VEFIILFNLNLFECKKPREAKGYHIGQHCLI